MSPCFTKPLSTRLGQTNFPCIGCKALYCISISKIANDAKNFDPNILWWKNFSAKSQLHHEANPCPAFLPRSRPRSHQPGGQGSVWIQENFRRLQDRQQRDPGVRPGHRGTFLQRRAASSGWFSRNFFVSDFGIRSVPGYNKSLELAVFKGRRELVYVVEELHLKMTFLALRLKELDVKSLVSSTTIYL